PKAQKIFASAKALERTLVDAIACSLREVPGYDSTELVEVRHARVANPCYEACQVGGASFGGVSLGAVVRPLFPPGSAGVVVIGSPGAPAVTVVVVVVTAIVGAVSANSSSACSR